NENPPTLYGGRPLRPIRVPSPRQPPTDHDCAVSTRGYQSDQPSHWPLVLSPPLSLQFAEARLNSRLDTVAPYQKLSFNPNCTSRGSNAAVIWPKLPVLQTPVVGLNAPHTGLGARK